MTQPLSGDPEADAQILLGEAGGVSPMLEGNQEMVLGGFAGGIAQTGSIWPGWAQNAGVGRPHTVVTSAPLYVKGDEFSWLDAKPLEERIRIQDELLALGLTSSVIPGEFDDGTLAGMRQLMTLANRSGERVEQTIGRLRSLSDQGLLESAKKSDPVFNFVGREYLPLSRDVVEDNVRDMTARMFSGTDIKLGDEEIAYLAGEFDRLSREQHFGEEQQRLSREYTGFQADVASRKGEQVSLSVDAVPQVDAGGEFKALLAERFRPKTEAIERMGVNDESRALTANALGKVLSFATGR